MITLLAHRIKLIVFVSLSSDVAEGTGSPRLQPAASHKFC